MRTALFVTFVTILFLATGCGGGGGAGDGGSSGSALDITDQTFNAEVLKAAVPVMVMFYLPTCPHCQRMQQPVADLARDMAADLKVARLNVGANSVMAGRYNIGSVPTFMIFKSGRATASVVGEMSEAALFDWTRNALAE
jgi:thioredoxin 1